MERASSMRRSILADGFWLASAASDMIRSYVGLRVCLLRCLGGYLQIGDKKRYKLQNERNGTRLRRARSGHPMQVSIMTSRSNSRSRAISAFGISDLGIASPHLSPSLAHVMRLMARPRHEEAPSEEAAATRCAGRPQDHKMCCSAADGYADMI